MHYFSRSAIFTVHLVVGEVFPKVKRSKYFLSSPNCNILSLNIPVTDELLVIRLIDPLGYVVSVDYRL